MKLLNNIKFDILSWLVHHANMAGKDENFYKIKNMILKKYGRLICYDVQFIEGSKCWSCNGTGRYKYPKWDYSAKSYYYEDCYVCYNGWYKRPTWNILARIKFGKYEFHQPFQRVYKKPEMSNPFIEGYIEHKRSRFTYFSKHVLFLLYEKGYLKRWWNETGNGWFSYWWKPRNWISNMVHIIKRGSKSIPFQNIKNRRALKRLCRPADSVSFDNDLPF